MESHNTGDQSSVSDLNKHDAKDSKMEELEKNRQQEVIDSNNTLVHNEIIALEIEKGNGFIIDDVVEPAETEISREEEKDSSAMDVPFGEDLSSSKNENSSSVPYLYSQACDSEEEEDVPGRKVTQDKHAISKVSPSTKPTMDLDSGTEEWDIDPKQSEFDEKVTGKRAIDSNHVEEFEKDSDRPQEVSDNSNRNVLVHNEIVTVTGLDKEHDDDGHDFINEEEPESDGKEDHVPMDEDLSSSKSENSSSLPYFYSQACDSDDEEEDVDRKIRIIDPKANDSKFDEKVTDMITGDVYEYRNIVSLVNYSDSDSDSDETTDSSTIGSDEDDEKNSLFDFDTDEDFDEAFDDRDDSGHDSDTAIDGKRKKQIEKRKAKTEQKRRVRTDGEIFPEELPPIDYLTISPGEDVVLEPVGKISGIVDVLVVIQAVEDSPALYDDSVLFLEDRQPLGLIFETLGTVEKPFYSVRFNSNQDIVSRNISIGDNVMYAPKADNLTKYVFIAELRKMRCNDASWEDDNEPPPEEKDFSDDDEEKKTKRSRWLATRRQRINEGPRKRRKRRTVNAKNKGDAGEGAPDRSRLLPGHMNRNPFEGRKKSVPFKSGQNKNRPMFVPSTQPAFGFVNRWTAPPPGAMFGGKPSWQELPGLVGPRPGAPFNFTPPTLQPFSKPMQPNLRGGSSSLNRPPPAGPNQNPFLPAFNSNIPPPPLPNRFSFRPPGVIRPQKLFSSFNFPPPPIS